MASLLDKVLNSKDNPTADSLLSPADDSPHHLPDGSTIYDSTVAAINRILELNPHLHKRSTGIASRPYALYNGAQPVDLADRRTFLSLLKADWTPRTRFQLVFLEQKILELAPVFSKDCIVVSDGLLWDREQGKLKYFTKLDNIRTGS